MASRGWASGPLPQGRAGGHRKSLSSERGTGEPVPVASLRGRQGLLSHPAGSCFTKHSPKHSSCPHGGRDRKSGSESRPTHLSGTNGIERPSPRLFPWLPQGTLLVVRFSPQPPVPLWRKIYFRVELQPSGLPGWGA